jgi:hypothetical protein
MRDAEMYLLLQASRQTKRQGHRPAARLSSAVGSAGRPAGQTRAIFALTRHQGSEVLRGIQDPEAKIAFPAVELSFVISEWVSLQTLHIIYKFRSNRTKPPNSIFIPEVIAKMMALYLLQTNHMNPRPRSLKRRMSNSINVITSDRCMTSEKLDGVATTNQLSVAWTLHDTQVLSSKFSSMGTPTNSSVNETQEKVYKFLMQHEVV